MGHSVRRIAGAAAVAVTALALVGTASGTALAATAGPGPGYKGPVVTSTVPPKAPVSHGSHDGYTKFTFTNTKGKKVTEWVRDSSIGYVTPVVPTDGQACTLDIIGQFIPGVDDGTYTSESSFWKDAWELFPGSSCIDYLYNRSHHHPHKIAPRHKAPVGE